MNGSAEVQCDAGHSKQQRHAEPEEHDHSTLFGGKKAETALRSLYGGPHGR